MDCRARSGVGFAGFPSALATSASSRLFVFLHRPVPKPRSRATWHAEQDPQVRSFSRDSSLPQSKHSRTPHDPVKCEGEALRCPGRTARKGVLAWVAPRAPRKKEPGGAPKRGRGLGRVSPRCPVPLGSFSARPTGLECRRDDAPFEGRGLADGNGDGRGTLPSKAIRRGRGGKMSSSGATLVLRR